MIRLTWILAGFVLAAGSGHFGYLHLVAPSAPPASSDLTPTPTGARPELAWLQRELELTPAQLTTVHALHEECWTEVPKLRAQLDAEQRNAQATGNHATRGTVEEKCRSHTVTFIEQVTAALTPPQRQKYLGLVGPCLPPVTRPGGAAIERSPGR